MTPASKKLAYILSGAVCIFLVGYTLFQAREYLSGPRISVESAVREGPLLALAGTAERISFLALNGKQIYTDEKGRWQETILLVPGYTIVTLAAKDRFGRSVDAHRDFYRKKEN